MRLEIALSIAFLWPASLTAHPVVPAVPTAAPWLILVHDVGLSGRNSSSLVFAIWRDGTILRRTKPAVSGAANIELAILEQPEFARLEAAIKASRLRESPSSSRYLDLPEDALVIRDAGETRCWFNTPGIAETPALSMVEKAVMRLDLKSATRTSVPDDQWLPWSHYQEASCQS